MNSARYGAPPAPQLSAGTPQYNVGEAPACVQNAMMTKDKKPFTYTPGGIDLSQIKSPRMAQRLARNAQNEGATGQQQMNRPQTQSNGASTAAQLGATAMGMPFQVLPTGPPPPPPQPNKAGGPPPPPPVPQAKLAPQANGNATRKSPTPQNFEPPPMGLRPEIKIPPNPMAALKKVTPPQEKNNFWVEEYRKERSKSPMVGNDENDCNRSPPNNQQPETNQYTSNNNQLPRQQNEYQPQRRSPSPQPLRPQPESYSQPNVSPPRTPVQQYVQEQPRRTETPNQAQYLPQSQQQQQQYPAIQRQFSHNQPQYQVQQTPPNSPQQQQSSPTQRQQQFNLPQQYQGPTPPQYQQPQQQLPQQPQQQSPQQTVPWRTQRSVPQNALQNNVSRPRDVMSPAPSDSPKPQPQQYQQPQQQQYPNYLRTREVLSPAPEPQPPQSAQPYQQKNAQVGSIYIPPVATQQQQQPQLRQAPANRWGSTQTSPVDTQTLNRLKSPPPPSSNGFSSSNNTGLKLQINTSGSNGKERIIPIQMEQTPTPTRTPAAPGFGAQPYYNANQQQYNSVPSPPLGQGNGQTSPGYVIRSPNQFVDQGYNNYPANQDPNRAGGLKERVIPIAVDSQPDGPLNPNNVRGPISKQPLVIQNDPRNQNPNAWGSGNTTPNQSRSFRILQKITDTAEDPASDSKAIESDVGDPEPQLQRPTFARQMGPGQLTSPTIDQMKRMQLNNDQAFANRTRNQEDEVDESATAKAVDVDPRYRGPSNPSKTFKKLQGAIECCSPSRTDRDGTPPVMKQPQPNRYVNQKPAYSQEEQSQQYVHPSEQQVPEPKKYTGSAIPSRSFKILQAMTTPENAAEMEGSDVVEQNKSITECPCQRAPRPFSYPYPYLPPCCQQSSNLSSNSVGDDLCNWQYPPHPSYPAHLPYHPHHPHHPHYPYHPHHHPHSHPHQHHPYPPCPCYFYYHSPNEYDSQGCNQCQAHDPFRRSKSMPQELPNIIITPSSDDTRATLSGRDIDLGRGRRAGSVIDTLSRMLNKIETGNGDEATQAPSTPKHQGRQSYENVRESEARSEISDKKDNQVNLARSTASSTITNAPKAEVVQKNLVNKESSTGTEETTSVDLVSPKSESTSKESMILQKEDKSKEISKGTDDQIESDDSSSDDLLTSSSEQSIILNNEECAAHAPNYGLQSIKSVTNIQVYQKKELSAMDTYDEDQTAADGESMIFDNEEEEEGEFEAEELEYDEEEGVIEEIASEEEEEEIKELEEDDEEEVVIIDNLSVIYEENETDATSPRPSSRVSSSVSDSTTLANEECELDEHTDEIKKEEEDDENSNSVTVRLPLKFSFSRSSNDENITTVEVGSSQIQERRRSFSVASIKSDSEDDEEWIDDCDVSVTISLSPSNSSIERKSSLSPIPRKIETKLPEEESNGELYDSEAENVLTSFSLPMRNKFMSQTWTGDITNNIAMEREATPDEPTEERRRKTSVGKIDIWASNNDPPKELVQGADIKRRNSRILEDKDENITDLADIKKKKIVEDIEKLSKSVLRESSKENSGDDSDFWATLQATRKEAQLLLEKTADYWGKKVNEKKKEETIVPTDTHMESDEDFWANIRVKDTVKPTMSASSSIERQESTEEEGKPNTPKPRKKKKIIKAVEKKPEPKHELTTINLPNAKNRARIVESTIKMIQDKVEKPKLSVKKEIKKEVEISDFVANIKESYDKEPKPAKPLLSRKFSRSLGSEDASEKEDKVIEIKEEKKVKPRKEIMQLLTQIFELKFARASDPLEKPIPLKATWDEIQAEDHTPNKGSEDMKTAPEKMGTAPKPKKKLTRSAKSTDEVEEKSTKSKLTKKTTRDSKKTKKKKEGDADRDEGKPGLIILNEEIKNDEGPASVAVEIIDEHQNHVKEVEIINEYEASPIISQEIDFWATIQTSESESCIESDASNLKKSPSDYDQDHDFWAEISASEDNETRNTTPTPVQPEPVKIEDVVMSHEPKYEHNIQKQSNDFWAEISASKDNENRNTTPTPVQPESVKIEDVVMSHDPKDEHNILKQSNDFWAEISAFKDNETRNSTSIPVQPESVKIEDVVMSHDPKDEHNILKQSNDFWAEISASKDNETRNTTPTPVQPEPVKIENVVMSHEPKYEHNIQKQSNDFWAEISAFKDNETRNSTSIPVQPEPVQTEDVVMSYEPKYEQNIQKQSNDFWAEISASEDNETRNTTPTPVQPEPVETEDVVMSHEPKDEHNILKQSNDNQEVDFRAEIDFTKKDEVEVDFWAEIEASKDISLVQAFESSALEMNVSEAANMNPKVQEPLVAEINQDSHQVEEPLVIEEKPSVANEVKKSKSKIMKKSKSTDSQAEGDSDKPKTKKKTLKSEYMSTETDPKSKQKKKKSLSKDDPTDFWAEVEASKTPSSKKTKKLSTLHVHNVADVELVNLIPAPIFYVSYTQVERPDGFWASVGYIKEEKGPEYKPTGNETEVNAEIDTNKIDFWVTQRKFETNSGFDREATPKQEETSDEVDFWAQIKGPEDEEESPAPVTKDVCEVRRNNYRNAMAFFTNTVSIEKKDDELMLSQNAAEEQNSESKAWDLREEERPKTSENKSDQSWNWRKEESQNLSVPPESKAIEEQNSENKPWDLREEERPKTSENKSDQSWNWRNEESQNLSIPPEIKSYKPWGWNNSVGHEWEAPDEREVTDTSPIANNRKKEDDTDTLTEKNLHKLELSQKDHDQTREEAPSESSESVDDLTPNHFEVQYQYPKPEPSKPKEQPAQPADTNKFIDEIKISVKDRIFAFESGKVDPPSTKNQPKSSLNVDSATPKSSLSRNSSQRSESEIEEDDSGVTDMKLLSETDTESESFPELRKMSHYQRASTHSRLFKLLQDECDIIEEETLDGNKAVEEELNLKPRKKIVHNVSVTRKQNPSSLRDAETMAQRRERLSLPLRKNTSIDADNPSSPNSPASPIFGQPSQAVSDKLVDELVQSLLLKKSSSAIKNLPMEKLQAAAKRALEEEMDSLENTSLDSTPALTPQEFKSESYSDYYDTWNAKNSPDSPSNCGFEIMPSKAFKNLQDTTATAKRRPWSVRCPRVLSSKTVNRDLARVTESPETCSRKSNSPDTGSDRAGSVSRWRKV